MQTPDRRPLSLSLSLSLTVSSFCLRQISKVVRGQRSLEARAGSPRSEVAPYQAESEHGSKSISHLVK
jgi:hypothetical protein